MKVLVITIISIVLLVEQCTAVFPFTRRRESSKTVKPVAAISTPAYTPQCNWLPQSTSRSSSFTTHPHLAVSRCDPVRPSELTVICKNQDGFADSFQTVSHKVQCRNGYVCQDQDPRIVMFPQAHCVLQTDVQEDNIQNVDFEVANVRSHSLTDDDVMLQSHRLQRNRPRRTPHSIYSISADYDERRRQGHISSHRLTDI